MIRLARALAVLATVVVLGSGAAAVAVYVAEGEPAASAPEGGDVDGRQVVTSQEHGASFEVPPAGQGWTVRAPKAVIYYLDEAGQPLIGVAAPAIYDAGYCGAAEGASNRAFVGFTRALRGVAVTVANERLVGEFVSGISVPRDGTGRHEVGPVATETVTLADGAAGVRSTVEVTLTERGPCEPRRVRLDLVTFESGDRAVTLVLVRDVGGRSVSDGVAESILQSLRSRT